jgi:hypothetical protein
MQSETKVVVEHSCAALYPGYCHERIGIFDSKEDAIEWFRQNLPYTFGCGRMIKNTDQITSLNMYPLPYQSCNK